MTFRHHLPHEDISALYNAAIAAGLTAQRTGLLEHIDPAFVAGLSTNPSPAGQIYTDLHALNALEALADGSVPLHTWLANARNLTASRSESALFQSTLARLSPAAAA